MVYTDRRNRFPNFFWWLLLFIVISVLLTSCVTEKTCSKYWTENRVDSIYVHDTIVYRDTLIKIEERTLTVFKDVPCDDFEVNKDSNGVKILLKVVNKRLSATAICEALEIKLRLMDRTRQIYKSTELTKVVKLKGEKTKFQIFKDYWFWITLTIIVTVITTKLLKTYAKFKLPF